METVTENSGTQFLKKDPSHLKMKPPSLKSKAPFQEMIPGKRTKKLETVINTCVSLRKQH